MKRLCMYCDDFLGYKGQENDGLETHGICDECGSLSFNELNRIAKQKISSQCRADSYAYDQYKRDRDDASTEC